LLGPFEGRRPFGAVLYSSNELGELSQWFCRDDRTINISMHDDDNDDDDNFYFYYYYYYYYYYYTLLQEITQVTK